MKKIYFIIISLLLFSCQEEIIEYELNIIKNPSEGGVVSPNGGFYRMQADGTYVYYRANGTPMTDADNAPIVYTKEQVQQLGIDKY